MIQSLNIQHYNSSNNRQKIMKLSRQVRFQSLKQHRPRFSKYKYTKQEQLGIYKHRQFKIRSKIQTKQISTSIIEHKNYASNNNSPLKIRIQQKQKKVKFASTHQLHSYFQKTQSQYFPSKEEDLTQPANRMIDQRRNRIDFYKIDGIKKLQKYKLKPLKKYWKKSETFQQFFAKIPKKLYAPLEQRKNQISKKIRYFDITQGNMSKKTKDQTLHQTTNKQKLGQIIQNLRFF